MQSPSWKKLSNYLLWVHFQTFPSSILSILSIRTPWTYHYQHYPLLSICRAPHTVLNTSWLSHLKDIFAPRFLYLARPSPLSVSENILLILCDTGDMSSPFWSVPNPLSNVSSLLSSQSTSCTMYMCRYYLSTVVSPPCHHNGLLQCL